MKSKRKSIKSSIEDANGIRISYHEKVCAERMKTLFKAIDEMKKDIKSLKSSMDRGKGGCCNNNFYWRFNWLNLLLLPKIEKRAAKGLETELLAAARFAKGSEPGCLYAYRFEGTHRSVGA